MKTNPSSRTLMLGGAGLFLGARLYMVFISAWLMGVPRLGDDAMLYVSKGVGFYRGYNHDSPLAKSFYEQVGSQNDRSEAQRKINWRIANQALGGATFTHDVFTGLVYKLLGNAKWTFAVTETAVALTMSACLLLFMKTFFGESAAGLSMLVLGCLLLPAQGIHYLIPSTLALSLGLLLMSFAATDPKPLPRLLLSSFLLCFLHNMGYVWICIAFALGALELRARRGRPQDLCRLGAALFSPLLLKMALVSRIGFFSTPQRALAPPSPHMTAVLSDNLSAFWHHLALRDPFFKLYLALAAGLAIRQFLRGRLDSRQKALAGLFLSALGASFFVHIPFYPSEVAFRVFTAFNLPLAGIFSCAVIAAQQAAARPLRRLMKAAIAGLVILAAYQFNGYVFANTRPFVIHDAPYRRVLETLDPRIHSLLFLETEYSFRQSVINGDERFTSYQWPLLSSQDAGPDYIFGKRPNVMILPVPESLNSANLSPHGRLIPREIGLAGAVVHRAIIEVGEGSRQPVYLLIKNKGAESILNVSASGDRRAVRVPARSTSNIRIDPAGRGLIEVTFHPRSSVWLSGISTGRPAGPSTLWPWGEAIKLEYAFYPDDATRGGTVDFSPGGLLKQWDASRLAERLKSLRPLSDASGLIVAQVEWK
ncbi:MAG: hypothetical protein HZB91_06750 [Elusimicrobia bacterium]|nr:hypothetical protein [Elusimicrobiota bacterium]